MGNHHLDAKSVTLRKAAEHLMAVGGTMFAARPGEDAFEHRDRIAHRLEVRAERGTLQFHMVADEDGGRELRHVYLNDVCAAFNLTEIPPPVSMPQRRTIKERAETAPERVSRLASALRRELSGLDDPQARDEALRLADLAESRALRSEHGSKAPFAHAGAH